MYVPRDRYTKERLIEAARVSINYTDLLRNLGKRWSGGLHGHVKQQLSRFNIDTSHFLGQRTNSGTTHKGGFAKRLAANTLVLRTTGRRERTKLLRRALLEVGVPLKCNICGLDPTWNTKPLTLEINHKNANNIDDRLENLEFLCPNCHSQIPNHAQVA